MRVPDGFPVFFNPCITEFEEDQDSTPLSTSCIRVVGCEPPGCLRNAPVKDP
jgi:hypothetical protein